MAELPNTLEEAIAQAKEATTAALADGYTRLQVELRIPELKPMPVAEQFLPVLESYGSRLKIFFPDAGAAALARRDWGDVPFKIIDIGTGRTPVETQIQPEDEMFLFIEPSAVEVLQVEKLCEQAGDRPVVMLNPRLEDISVVGVGYAGRQVRQRFLNNIETCYYIQSLEGAAVFRCYPSRWQVWREKNDNYQLITEQDTRPVGDDLDLILSSGKTRQADSPSAEKSGILAPLQRFLRSLSK